MSVIFYLGSVFWKSGLKLDKLLNNAVVGIDISTEDSLISLGAMKSSD